jgi:hypothetical protein
VINYLVQNIKKSCIFICMLISSFLPIWSSFYCNSWECRFKVSTLWTAIYSYINPENQPEAINILMSSLPAILFKLFCILLVGYCIGLIFSKYQKYT